MTEVNYRVAQMQKKNRLRALKVQAVVDVIGWLDKGAFPDRIELAVPQSMVNLPDVDAINWMPFAVDFRELTGNINSYRAELIAKAIGVNVDKRKLLRFAKPRDRVYSLKTQSVLALCHRYLYAIKMAVVMHYHNLKVAEFDSLVGLFFNAKSVAGVYAWVDMITNDADIFRLDAVSRDGWLSNL